MHNYTQLVGRRKYCNFRQCKMPPNSGTTTTYTDKLDRTMDLDIHLSMIRRELHMTTIALAFGVNLDKTAHRGTPDGSGPSPPEVVVCPTTYAAEVKEINVDKSLILIC